MAATRYAVKLISPKGTEYVTPPFVDISTALDWKVEHQFVLEGWKLSTVQVYPTN